VAVGSGTSRSGGTTRRPDAPTLERVRPLVAGALENLLATWDEETGLFPYSSRLVGGEVVNDVVHPLAVRYTINSLLGLARAANAGVGSTVDDVRALQARFEQLQSGRISTLGDAGLLLVLYAELEDDEGAAQALEHVRAWSSSPRGLVMQDLAWALWGSVAATRLGMVGAASVASELLGELTRTSMSPIGLPLHSRSRFRRRVVSFGAVTYFLRALHEAAVGLEDETADDLYRAGLARTLALQGSLGDWPWMIDPLTGSTLDRYPVFSVHQDSMAMLFLLPSLDRGLTGIEPAIEKSLAWSFGENELARAMYTDDPLFFAYRSIERRERAPRARRYLRSSVRLLEAGDAESLPARKLRLNPECRSYHLGWILYAWSDRVRDSRS
jgi:hypothetical protein